MVLDNFGDDGYVKVSEAIFPLLGKLLYDTSEEIRDKAISIVAELRTVVREKEKEHILKLTFELAHDDAETMRESAAKLLNELASDMGQELCEVFIVQEIRSLGMDPFSNVR